jgi:zinc protease
MGNVEKITLDNGLSIFLKEIHSAPIISFWTWYKVGSRYEKPGHTGISHWVEHMQFKGTKKYPSSLMDRLISREGGIWNAFTHLDWTTYFETMPANKIDIALELEADRIFNSLFKPEDVESERTVIISEKEGKENEPFLRLNSAVNEASFKFHPYRNEVIGTLEDLKRIQREDLYNHYRNYYHPANCLVSIAGDFDTKTMLSKLRNLFENKPANNTPNHTILPEPELTENKEILLTGPGDTIFLQISYRAPAASDPEFFAYSILDSLLTGPASLNMFGGGGVSNKTSRMYKKLVDKNYAISIAGGLQATVDPYLYDLSVTLHDQQDPHKAIEIIDMEIDRIITKRIRGSEIQRAVKQAKALFAYGLENITNQAFWLGYSENFANYEWFQNYLERLNAVKPQDVQKVAEKYLNPSKRVIGIYLPENNGDKSL